MRIFAMNFDYAVTPSTLKTSPTMKRFFVTLALVWIGANASFAQLMNGKPLVTPSLHVGTTDFSKPFTVAIRFAIEPEWHLYWRNPGDAGIPPEVKWTLPKGFSASAFRFPTPHKIVSSGVVAYGYDTELVLLSTITPDANTKSISASDAVINAELTWLVCRENCIPGNGSVMLNLLRASPKAISDGIKMIAETEARLPKLLTTKKISAQAAAKQEGDKLLVSIDFTGDDAKRLTDFYPDVLENFVLNYDDIKIQNGQLTFPLRASNKTAKLTSLNGLLVFGNEASREATEFSTPIQITSGGASDGTSSGGNSGGGSSGGLLNQSFTPQNTTDENGMSLGWALVFAFIGGLILNIMPCVLPVISLKVMSFVEQSGSGKSKSFKHGLVFALGVLVSFWVLALVAVVLQSAGEQIGWGFQFQSPAFVVAMAGIIFVFGLNLIGVFEFAAPSISGEAGATLSRRDAVGSFMNGVLATVLATPCTAPFLGSALGFAFSQPAAIIVLIFTTVGLGLATPYLILSAKPEWLKFIPKPGEWMNRFKQIMGFLLFATVVWLLSVVGSQLGAEGVVATVALLLGVAVSAWVIGNYITYSSRTTRKVAVWSVALLLTLSSYYVTFERWLDWRTVKTVAATTSSQSGHWLAFSPETVEKHVRSGKPVFIDFTADWCFTCKVTERTVLETDAVQNKIKELGIVTVKADWTNRNDDITQLLKKFGRSGVPLYVVFPANKLSEPIILPEVITPELLINAFEKAAPTLSDTR
jgi:thiol:disulfide interchange protein/DsbC/DsbD-like thiol-disulfide interchange protein